MNQPMEAQRNQDPRLLLAFGLKRYRLKQNSGQPPIELNRPGISGVCFM